MNMKSRVSIPLLLSLTMLLASCGGAGGGSVAEGGIRGTGSSVGPVSGFGSVIVNGIRFVTENLGMDDFQGEAGVSTEEDLERGMILQIHGEWRDSGEGEADSVRYDDTLRGPVTGIPQPWDETTRQGRIEVMGFEVNLDALTQTTLADLATISVGQTLRVSGWLRADGRFRASYVGPVTAEDTGEELEGNLSVTGDEPNQRYFVDGLELQILSGAVCDPLQLADGMPVDVEGEYVSGAPFTVSRICNGGPSAFLDASLNDDVQIAGVVTRAFAAREVDSGSFALNGIPVATHGGTEFGDLMSSDINPGVLLQVEGDYINDNGVLTLRADEIEYRDTDAELEGRLDGIDSDVLQSGGVEILLTAFTIRGGDDDDEACPVRFGPEHVGRIQLEVSGIQRSADGGYLEALEIECESEADDSGYEIEGRVTALNDEPGTRTLTILGAVIRVDAGTGFEGLAFADLEGERVEVEYREVNGEYIAEEIESENETDSDNDD
ncbi:DUF5666 domain-containing protein [Marinobacter sp. OP 3.4]|uniref:DUF5666 domain-containing protein n=1 Tax=Marinobacter sp. OP 3.4 TaxID=3076501 RepID=UPI002E228DEF